MFRLTIEGVAIESGPDTRQNKYLTPVSPVSRATLLVRMQRDSVSVSVPSNNRRCCDRIRLLPRSWYKCSGTVSVFRLTIEGVAIESGPDTRQNKYLTPVSPVSPATLLVRMQRDSVSVSVPSNNRRCRDRIRTRHATKQISDSRFSRFSCHALGTDAAGQCECECSV